MKKNEKKEFRLIELYKISFNEMKDFRNNAGKVVFGYIGLFSILLGVIFTPESKLVLNQKIGLTIGIIIICLFFLYVLKIMKSYFLSASKIINKIDKYYDFYKSNEFIKDDSILPKEWENFGDENWKEPIFIFSTFGILLFSVLAICLIWFLT